MDIAFGRPIFLWLILVIPVIVASHFVFLKRTQIKAMRFANFEAIKRIAKEKFVTKNTTHLILRVITIFLFILALAEVQVWYNGLRNDYDYVIVMDTSASMVTNDLKPTRLEVAKQSALSLIDSMESDTRFGLVSFGGYTYIHQTLTDETFDIRLDIANLNISRASGSDLAGGIVAAINVLSQTDRAKSIIVFSDGVDTVGAYIDDSIRRAVNYAINQKVSIHTVGLGTANAPAGYLPESYNLTVSIDKEALEYIATETGGVAVFPKSKADIDAFIDILDSKSLEAPIEIPAARYALLAGFVLLFIDWGLMNLLFRRVI